MSNRMILLADLAADGWRQPKNQHTAGLVSRLGNAAARGLQTEIGFTWENTGDTGINIAFKDESPIASTRFPVLQLSCCHLSLHIWPDCLR